MASLQRTNGRYVLQWRDALGQHKKVIGRVGVLPEREAQRVLRAKQYELDTGRSVLGHPPSPFFSDFAKDYIEWHQQEFPHSHYRVEQIVNDHLSFFDDIRIGEIRPKEDVEEWKKQRRPAVKSATLVKELRTLNAILNRAVKWKVIQENPIESVDPPKILDSKPKLFYTREQVAELLTQHSGPIWRLYVNTGMRRGEGMILRKEWVRPGALQILSTDEDRTKAGRWREIPLTDGAEQALEEIRGEDGYVLPRMRLESLSRACIRESKRAGLSGSIHTLRHTYISHLVMGGTPLRTVKELAGHSSITVTEGYAHLAPDHLAKAGRSITF